MGSSPVPRTSVAARRRSRMPARNRAGILLPLLRLRHAAQKHGRSLYISHFRPANCAFSLRFCLAVNVASSEVAAPVLRRERTSVPHRFLCKATVANACTKSCRHFASTPAAPPRRAKTRTLVTVQASGGLPGGRKAKAVAFGRLPFDKCRCRKGFAVARGRVRRGGRWRTGGLVSILSVRGVRGFLLSAQLVHFLCPFLLSFDVLLDLRDGADILMCARIHAGCGMLAEGRNTKSVAASKSFKTR